MVAHDLALTRLLFRFALFLRRSQAAYVCHQVLKIVVAQLVLSKWRHAS